MAQDEFRDEDGDEVYVRAVWAGIGLGRVRGQGTGSECWIVRADGTVVYQARSGERRLGTIVTAENLRKPGPVWERVSAVPEPEPEPAVVVDRR